MNKNLNDIIKQIYENIPDGVLILSLTGEVLFTNREFMNMSGYNKAELFNMDYHILFEKKLKHDFHYAMESFTNKEVDSLNFINQKLMTKDHRTVDVNVNANIVSAGDQQFIASIFHDATDYKTLKHRLIKETERMKEAKELAKFGHWEFDRVKDELYWSDEVYEMFGLEKKLHKPTYELFIDRIHPEDQDYVKQAYASSTANKTGYEVDHRVVIDDKTMYFKEKGRSFYEGDKVVKSIGLIQDITESMIHRIEVKRKDAELLKSKSAIISSLSSMTEIRDHETGKHLERTQHYIRLLANKLMKKGRYDFTHDYIDMMVQVSSLHDIGKVGIPDNILKKSGPLSEEEYDIMKTHTIIGNAVIEKAKLASDIHDNAYLITAQNIILNHHEKWDGSGYPNGKRGHDIPIVGRLMALVDVYDALRSKRVYKDEFTHQKSMDIILRDTGKHFDPELVVIFIENEKEFERISNKLKS